MLLKTRRRTAVKTAVAGALMLTSAALPIMTPAVAHADTPAPYVYQTASFNACANSATFTFPRATTAGSLLVMTVAVNNGNGNSVSSPGGPPSAATTPPASASTSRRTCTPTTRAASPA
jgi:hypothetical protein